MEVRPARIKPRPEPAMGNPPRLQRVGRHCRKRKREEGGGRGRAAPVAACTWPWRRSGGGGVGRCSSRRPRQATTWCHLPPTPAASCCGCWQWRSESPTLPPPLLAVRPSFRPWRRRPPASAGSARWQATTTATSASKTPGLCWNIFGHCLINFTELLNTIDLCGNRWSISRMYKKQSASVHARALKKGSGGDVDGRREVRGLDGVVAADVRRGEAAARHLPLAPQHTGCGPCVRWLPPSAGGVTRGRHRPGPA
uniref:Uncharacterized protein n=2 Tax=Triticum urartu TaxID=4572 RepID=A0A8R7QAA8_TRIUA